MTAGASSREWDAASYHEISDQQFAWGVKVLQRAPLLGDETVLDAGCGTGRVTAHLLERLPRGRVLAVDLSENMLRAARGQLASTGNRVHLVCADLARLPFVEAVDLIFSTAALHWVLDHEQLFCNLFAALKPGGRLEAQCGGGPNLARLRAMVSRIERQPAYYSFFDGWTGPWEFASPEATRERMTRVGFVEVETWLESASFRLPSREQYRRFFATVVLHRHAERIPDVGLRDRYLDEVVDAVCREPDFQLDYWRLNLRGRKPH